MLLKKVILTINVGLIILFLVGIIYPNNIIFQSEWFNKPIILLFLILLYCLYLGILIEEKLHNKMISLVFSIFGILLFFVTIFFLLDESSNLKQNYNKIPYLIIILLEAFYNFIVTKNVTWELNSFIRKKITKF